jgi:SAM-dependent methyltransferase
VPEADLIRRAIRVGPPGNGTDCPPDALDWPRLIDVAREQGVLAFVARVLKNEGWNGLPADVVQSLEAYRSALAARNLFLTRQLLELLELLGSYGITALPYKGPVLAAYAYGDLGMRPFSDLDLILSERDVLAARDLLVSEGYRSLSPRTDSERPGILPPGYALALQGADDRVVVELHWKLAPSFPLTVEDLLPGTRPFPLLDTSVLCLSPEQFLLVLCVHGSKHAWERLEWVCSVAHLIGRHPDLDWERLAAEAKALRAGRSVALGLALAVGVAGAPVPDNAMRAIGTHAVARLASDIEAGLFKLPRSTDAVLRYSLRFRAHTVEDRVRYFLFLRHPTEKDREFLKLPKSLSFLYFLVRPLRVVYEHAPRRNGSGRRERVGRRHAERARVRQLAHQSRKASALRGRDDEVIAALALRWDRVRRKIERVKPGRDHPRMLEVGSGAHGILFGSASDIAVGVDPLAADYARLFPAWQRRMPTVAAVGEHLPFADATFDIVLCDNVVDHAEGPAAILAEITRVLAPGGLLYFTVNVHHRLYSVLARAHRAWNAAGIPLEIGPFADHTFHFTVEDVRDLFSGLPMEIRQEHAYLDDAKLRARRRRLRHPGHVLPLVFFKNAPFEVIAERR